MFMLGGGLLAGVIFSRLEGPRSHGPGDLMLAIHKDHDPDLKGGFLTSALTLVSVSSGASVGVFGPIIHYGGCIATWLKQFFSNLSRPVILASGGAAAIGALFSAPIAAAIFAHEMLLRRVRTSESAPVVMAALGGYFSAVMLLGDNRRFLNVVGDPLPFSPFALGMAVAVGICCGLVSSLYIYLVTSGPGWAKQSKIPPILRPLVAAAILFAISPFFPQLIGPGMPSVNMAIAGKFSLVLLVCLVFLKVCATAMCRSLGFHGGIFLPAVFIGAMIGGIFDLLVGEGSHMFALLGAAACTGSAIGAPIAAVVILFEMSGDYRFIVLAMVSVAISCQISRSLVARSIWDRGLLLRGFDLDKEAEEIYRKHHPDKS
jgi:CIC family chloride channel protein